VKKEPPAGFPPAFTALKPLLSMLDDGGKVAECLGFSPNVWVYLSAPLRYGHEPLEPSRRPTLQIIKRTVP